MREHTYNVLINIAAGIFSSLIFWLVFVWWPEKRRRTDLRPKLELGIYDVCRKLFEIFDLIMRNAARSPSPFQKEIEGHLLTAEHIELGLQNKVLNETFVYDQESRRFLIAIGDELSKKRDEIDRAIDRLFQFSNYLKPGEILLLEQIRGKLHVYDLDRSAVTQIGGVQYAPVNPSMSYMRENLWQLYKLFCVLRITVFKNKYEDRDVLLDKLQYFYHRGDYKKCKRFVRRARTKLANDAELLEFYLFRCEYMNGDEAGACKRLERILAKKPDLISCRDFLTGLITDSRIRSIVKRQYSEAGMKELTSVVCEEEKGREKFMEQARNLRARYQAKENSLLNKKRG
jgi:hypothetical protein